MRWNGSARTTTYVSPTQLTAAITAADIASAGTFPVTVFNPTPGGGTSNAVNFVVSPGGNVLLAISPISSSATLGQTFDVAIEVQAGTQPVDGAAAYINFNTTYLHVVSITPGGALPTVLQNSFDNTSGQINYAAGTLSNFPSGTFTLATVRFTAISVTPSTPLTFNTILPRESDVTYGGSSVLDSLVNGTVEITYTATINGAVLLQGRPTPPNARWSVPLTVTLTIPGNSTPAYTFTPTTDTSGNFSVTGILPGTYDVRVKHSHTLRNLKTVSLIAGTNTVNFGTLLEGDANNDNYVTLLDFSVLAASYAKCEGTTGYDARADFNLDTCITLLDFSLLATNYSKGGDQVITILISPETGSQSTETVVIIVDPPLRKTIVGSTFTVTIQVQAGGLYVDGAQASLDFDPSRLRVKQMTGNTTLLPNVLMNTYDNSAGTLDYAAGTLLSFPTGSFNLVQIEFEALVETTGTLLEFHFGGLRNTEVTYGGYSILTADQDGSVIIVQGTKSFMPVLMR